MLDSFFNYCPGKVLLKVTACLWVFCFLPGLWGVHAADVSPAVVRLFEKAEVAGDRIRLGAVAEIKEGAPVLVKKLEKTVIGNSPLPGDPRKINRRYIGIRLQQKGIDLAGVSLEGAQVVEVFRASARISKTRIRKMVADSLCKKIPCGEKGRRIKDIRVDHDVVLPKGEISYRVVFPENRDFLGKFPVAVLCTVDGRYQKRIWTTVRVEEFKKVVVTRKPLPRYKVIDRSDVCLRRMNLADLPSNVLFDLEKALGKRTKRAIDAQVAIRPDHVELPPLVRRGDVVLMIAESEALRVTAYGKVMERGCRAERIRIENLASHKEVYAKVVDGSTVRVEFERMKHDGGK